MHGQILATRSSVARMMIAAATRHGPRAAVCHGGQTLSYSGLVAQSARLAGAMRAAGVGHGDLVAIALPRGAAPIVGQWAAWQLGAAYLPLDPDWPAARLDRLVTAAACRAIVAPAELAAEVAPGLPRLPPDIAAEPLPTPTTDDPDDLAYVIYTSGSTGAPKGVEITQANLAALVAWHGATFGLTPGTRASHLAGLAFDAAAWEVWPALAHGAMLVVPEDETIRYDPPRLGRWLVEQRIEVCFAPTATAEALLALDWPADTALRTLLTGADRLKRRPPAGLPFALVNNYGPTECTVVATSGVVAPAGDGLPHIGRPIPGTHIHLLDAAGREVRPGEAGEIHIGGALVGRGYRGDAALTAERFISHPEYGRLYRSGDEARRDSEGKLHFLGRRDAQIKLRGHRIEPAEIEAALGQVAGVAAAAVALVEDELVGYLVVEPGAALSAAGLSATLARTLPALMVPSRFARINHLPLTSAGKVDRAALGALPAAPLGAAAGRRPTTPTETTLAAIVGEVIGRDNFGIDDDFFLLGGHSLLGTQVIVRARAAFGVELTLLHLFEARTVAALAAKIEELALARLASLSDADIARLIGG